jgi:hypothetical protein
MFQGSLDSGIDGTFIGKDVALKRKEKNLLPFRRPAISHAMHQEYTVYVHKAHEMNDPFNINSNDQARRMREAIKDGIQVVQPTDQFKKISRSLCRRHELNYDAIPHATLHVWGWSKLVVLEQGPDVLHACILCRECLLLSKPTRVTSTVGRVVCGRDYVRFRFMRVEFFSLMEINQKLITCIVFNDDSITHIKHAEITIQHLFNTMCGGNAIGNVSWRDGFGFVVPPEIKKIDHQSDENFFPYTYVFRCIKPCLGNVSVTTRHLPPSVVAKRCGEKKME